MWVLEVGLSLEGEGITAASLGNERALTKFFGEGRELQEVDLLVGVDLLMYEEEWSGTLALLFD